VASWAAVPRPRTPTVDHDRRFKALIREFFREFFQLFFAEWTDLIDFSDVEWLEQEVPADPPDAGAHVLDVVARVRSREAITPWHDGRDGRDCLLVVLIEIESPDRTTSIRHRMPRYVRDLGDKLDLPILPVVLFLKVGLNGVGRLEYRRQIRGLVVDYSECLYVGLPGLDAVQYMEGDNWLGVALSALMRIPAERIAWLGAEALRRLTEAPLDHRRKFLLVDCVQAYLPMTDEQRREFIELLSTDPYKGVQAVNVTVYDEGLMKGELKGLIRGLVRAANLKFGREIPEVTAKLKLLGTPEAAEQAQTLLHEAATPEAFLQSLRG
jgi:hypothetical protein